MATPAAVEPIEQFISLALVLIQASVDFAGNVPDERPVDEVSNDIRRLRTATEALLSALNQAERRIFQPVMMAPVARNRAA